MMYCFAKFCRLCLIKSDSLLDYQTKDADNISLINKINTLMPSLIISNENYPTLICGKCCLQLNNSYKFFKDCFKTNQRLVKYNYQLNFNGDKVNRELNVTLDKLEGVEYNISGIGKGDEDEGYVVNLNIENIDLEIKNEVKDAVIINPEKFEVDEDLALNKIDDERSIKDDGGDIKIGVALIKHEAEEGLTLNDKDEEGLTLNDKDEEGLTLKDEEGLTLKEKDEENSNFDKMNKGYVCKSCGKTFANKSGLNCHFKNIHLKIRHNCKFCGKVFTQSSSLYYHERVVHFDIKKHKCDYCEKKFAAPKLLKRHLNTCKSRTNTEGDVKADDVDKGNISDEGFNREDEGLNREDEGLNREEEPLQQTKSEKTTSNKKKMGHVCKSCGKSFSLLQNLDRHFKNIHLKIRYSCKICNKIYTQLSSLEYHERVFHLGIRKHKCEYCERRFPLPKQLKYHLKACKNRKEIEEGQVAKAHNDVEEIKILNEEEAEDIEAVFIKKEEHDDDEGPSSSNRKRRVCQTCGKSFSNKTSLNCHVKNIHLKIRHSCKVCGRTFALLSTLKTHERRVHLNICTHKCEYCNRRFSSSKYLKSHLNACKSLQKQIANINGGNIKINEKEMNVVSIIKRQETSTRNKQRVCKICGKFYFHNTSLKNHIESVHLKITHNCEICNKSFTSVNSLKCHKRVVHLNIRKHKCEYCGHNFPQPRHLRSHLKACKLRIRTILRADTTNFKNANTIFNEEKIPKYELKTEEIDIE